MSLNAGAHGGEAAWRAHVLCSIKVSLLGVSIQRASSQRFHSTLQHLYIYLTPSALRIPLSLSIPGTQFKIPNPCHSTKTIFKPRARSGVRLRRLKKSHSTPRKSPLDGSSGSRGSLVTLFSKGGRGGLQVGGGREKDNVKQ